MGVSAHLNYAFQERSGYIRDDHGRARFDRRRQITEFFRMEPRLRASLTEWLKSGRTKQPLRLTSKILMS